jgi:hypothetical protein
MKKTGLFIFCFSIMLLSCKKKVADEVHSSPTELTGEHSKTPPPVVGTLIIDGMNLVGTETDTDTSTQVRSER